MRLNLIILKKMKKFLAMAAFVLAGFGAQAQVIQEGESQLNAGVGFSSYGVPVYVGLDYGVTNDISVGGEISYRSHTNGYWKTTALGIAVNGNYHFNRILNIPSEWDFYAGLSLGYVNWTTKWNGDEHLKTSEDSLSPLGFSAQVGGRYYFNSKFGVNLEFGGGNAFSGGKVGITYKF